MEGRTTAAAGHFAESLRAFRDAGLVTQVGLSLAELSKLLVEAGYLDVAGRFSGTLWKLHQETGATFDDDAFGLPLVERGAGHGPSTIGPPTSPPLPLSEAVSEAIEAADALAEGRAVPKPSPRSRTQAPIRLSDRERDVLALLAQRYTAPEIADRLFISVRTVEHHVSNIYNKLGVNSRRAAAAVAVQLGLV